MEHNALTALCPLDGRYREKLDVLQPIFSEYGLIHHRVLVEVRWLEALANHSEITEISPLTKSQTMALEKIINDFSLEDAKEIKNLEKKTNHDVKAVEYFLQNKFSEHNDLKKYSAFLHFACTSEDINNLAYALMLKKARETVMIPTAEKLLTSLVTLGKKYAHVSMLARTHGQPASPTTLGKEFINFAYRLNKQLSAFKQCDILGKFNGAVGNYNAHHISYPKIDWLSLTKKFVNDLGLTWNAYSTQIESHDFIAEFLQALIRFNNVLIDFDRDLWGYISLNYFHQKKIDDEVGSSTMPHKINPIDFENSEGNLGIANALANHLANKLPISRWQRDLTDSTVMRNLGQVLGFSLLALESTQKGLNKLVVNEMTIQQDLDEHWEVLGEAIQTVMRRHGITDAYEQLKAFTRGKTMSHQLLQDFIQQLPIPEESKKNLMELSPKKYIGYAAELVKQFTL